MKNIEKDMRHTLRRAEESQLRHPKFIPVTQVKPPPLKAPMLTKIQDRTANKFKNIFVEKKLNDFIDSEIEEIEKEEKARAERAKKKKEERAAQTSSPVKIESRPKPIPPVEVLPKPAPVVVPAPIVAMAVPPAPVPPPAPREKPAISFEEAVKLIVDDIEHHNTWPPRAADAVFELYRVRTMRSESGDPKFYSSGNSIHAAICIRYPRYKTRGGNRPYIPPTPPAVSENTPPPLPTPPPAPAPAAEPKSEFEAQVRGIMEMPGLSDEKRQAMLRLLLDK